MDNVYQPEVRLWTRERYLVAAALGIWFLLLACGWWSMTHFAYQVEEPPTASPATWPHESKLPHQLGYGQLLVFIHPLCPCSQATLAELQRILSPGSAARANPVQIVVAIVTPHHPDPKWTDSPLIQRFRDLAGAQVVFDAGGVEAERFGAASSGTILYFDAEGQRRYSGGITQSRGHVGDNPGQLAVAQLLAGSESTGAPIPPFGCRLVCERQLTNSNSNGALPRRAD